MRKNDPSTGHLASLASDTTCDFEKILSMNHMTTFMSISDIRRKKQFTLNNYWECDTLLTILSLILRRESESKVVKSCLTLCDPMDCSLPGPSVHGIFPGNSTGVVCHFLLQGIFPTQGWNLGLPHCRQTLYHLSHQGSSVLILRDILYCDASIFTVPWKI